MYQEKKLILPVTRILKTYVELQAIITNKLLLLNILLYARNLSTDYDHRRPNKKKYNLEIDLKSYFIYELIKNQNQIDTFCQYKLDINKKKLLDKYCTSLQIYHNVFLIFENNFEQTGPVVKNYLNKKGLFQSHTPYTIGTQTSNDFIDISTLNGIKLSSILKNYKKIYIGQKSTISIHNINKTQKKIIGESIKYDICNQLIVKKISRQSRSSSPANHEREIRILKALYKKTHFPVILSTKDNSLIMSYCGTKITKYNIPSDWKIQINEIINSLNSTNIRKNNMWKNNFLVQHSILYIINFTCSSNKIEFPCQNIRESDIESVDNFIQLLGAVYRRSIKL